MKKKAYCFYGAIVFSLHYANSHLTLNHTSILSMCSSLCNLNKYQPSINYLGKTMLAFLEGPTNFDHDRQLESMVIVTIADNRELQSINYLSFVIEILYFVFPVSHKLPRKHILSHSIG